MGVGAAEDSRLESAKRQVSEERGGIKEKQQEEGRWVTGTRRGAWEGTGSCDSSRGRNPWGIVSRGPK